MTYLNLVNNVLRRLREDQVTTVYANTYSTMIGDFINDAKGIIETAWDWSHLRKTIDISTIDGIHTYSLLGTQDYGKILTIMNDTANMPMEYRPQSWVDEKYVLGAAAEGIPTFYTYNGVDDAGDSQIDLYPRPNDTYVIKAKMVIRNAPLAVDADKLFIPSQPVLHLALALASRERGETGGTSTPEYFALADKYLSDAIAMDAQKHPDETIWYTP